MLTDSNSALRIGILIDQLMGPQVTLYSLSWHPTRAFITVGTSDGMIDIWGQNLEWSQFAPDFQALQKNMEYIEKEDEFDVVVDSGHDEELERMRMKDLIEQQTIVDVMTVTKVPAFEDDSEDEEEVFCFDQGLIKKM